MIQYAKIAVLVLLPIVLVGFSFYFGMQDQGKDDFTVSGTTDGPAVNVAIVGPDYTGATDWMTISDLKRKAWSPYSIQVNTAEVTPSANGRNKWRTVFHPVPIGEYKLITYDSGRGEQIISVQNLAVGHK